jgi:hypothetical protein
MSQAATAELTHVKRVLELIKSPRAKQLFGVYAVFSAAVDKFTGKATPANWQAVLRAVDDVDEALQEEVRGTRKRSATPPAKGLNFDPRKPR